ncbi:unannotated protein [freshwater metagenome]|uniref:Unannotated protein n=1 Tax=freshwater metagenome TaxID=449393 RepID=A0A6J6F5H0_9ZZZZ
MPASVVEKFRVAPVPVIDDALVAESVGAVASNVVSEICETEDTLFAESLTTT